MKSRKEYIGYRVIKKHSFRLFMTSVFAILLIAIPTITLLYTWISFSVNNGEPTILTGLDAAKFSYQFLFDKTNAINHPYYTSVVDFISTNASVFENVAGIVYQYFPIALTIFIALEVVFCLVLLIIALKGMIAGRLKHWKGPTIFATLLVVATLFSSLVTTCVALFPKFFIPGATTNYSFGNWWYCWIIFGASFILRFCISFIYEYGIYDHIYIDDKFRLASLKEANETRKVLDEKHFEIEEAPISNTPNTNRQQMPDEEIERVNATTELNKESKRVLKKRPEQGLPNNLRTINPSQFSQNLSLTTAIIPYGIKKIPQSAFSNCVNLTTLSIPVSVTEISANAFFNCVKLKKIVYRGKLSMWKKVARGSNWLVKSGTTIVTCTDGSVIVNPYH